MRGMRFEERGKEAGAQGCRKEGAARQRDGGHRWHEYEKAKGKSRTH
jgi:hypothetical protein